MLAFLFLRLFDAQHCLSLQLFTGSALLQILPITWNFHQARPEGLTPFRLTPPKGCRRLILTVARVCPLYYFKFGVRAQNPPTTTGTPLATAYPGGSYQTGMR